MSQHGQPQIHPEIGASWRARCVIPLKGIHIFSLCIAWVLSICTVAANGGARELRGIKYRYFRA